MSNSLGQMASATAASSAPPHSLNAAFLQEIKEDNLRLRELLAQAASILSMPRRIRTHELVDTIGELCDQLAMHFALENAYGYLDNALEVAPRLCRRAWALRGEHDALFSDFREIAEEAENLLDRPHHRRRLTHLAVKFFDFQARFHAHEACENELIFEAFDDDVGVGD